MGREEVNKMYKDHNHTHAVKQAETAFAKCIVSGLKQIKDSPFIPYLLTDKVVRVSPAADAKFVSDNLPSATEPATAPAAQ